MILLALTTLLPAWVVAQRAEALPSSLTEVRLSDYAKLTVRQGTENRFEAAEDFGGSITRTTSQMLLGDDVAYGTLFLAPGSSMSFNIEDNAELTFQGDFNSLQSLTLHIEDKGKASAEGKKGDSLRVDNLKLHTEDRASFYAYLPVRISSCNVKGEDQSVISIPQHRIMLSDGGKLLIESTDQSKVNFITDSLMTRLGLADRTTASSPKEVQAIKWTPRWESELVFAWGLNTWGDDGILSGFKGADGSGSVRTSWNNVQLEVHYPLINTHHFALMAGVGLEWSKYKFDEPYVVLGTDAATGEMCFVGGASSYSKSQTRLKTRYFTVPITLAFGNPNGWQLRLAAIGGLHWSGKNTGLRYEMENGHDHVKTKDFTVNRYIRPYKLDVRLSVAYDGFGAYLQLPMFSQMKDGFTELYPLKFGLLFAL